MTGGGGRKGNRHKHKHGAAIEFTLLLLLHESSHRIQTECEWQLGSMVTPLWQGAGLNTVNRLFNCDQLLHNGLFFWRLFLLRKNQLRVQGLTQSSLCCKRTLMCVLNYLSHCFLWVCGKASWIKRFCYLFLFDENTEVKLMVQNEVLFVEYT